MMGAAELAPSFESKRRLAGTRLGKYQVGARIGSGGSASVYVARLSGANDDEKIVALKVVHEHLSEENDFIDQFLDEANLLVRLSHPNIVQVHELGREGETLFLAMEYLHGQPLNRFVRALSLRSRVLPPDLVAWVGSRLADALAYAHGLTDKGKPLNLVHRDVSPQNVFITYDGQVRLIDFGIARAARRIAQTTLGRIKGKFSYMAPEQVLGRPFDHRADLFALGATLHEAATGARLFTGADAEETIQNILLEEVPDLRSAVEGFPEMLAEILKKSLASKPEDRFQSGTEMARAFDAYLETCADKDFSGRLAALICDVCEEDRLEMQVALDSLRSHPERSRSTTIPAPTTEPAPPKAAPRRGGRGVVAAALGLAVLGGVVVASKQGQRPPGESAPASPSVSIEVVTQPDVDARITLGGEALQGRPARLSRARGETQLEVVVEAPGYQTARLGVVPDRDRSLTVTLVQSAPPPSSAQTGKSTEAPAPAPSAAATVVRLPRPQPSPSAEPTPSTHGTASAPTPAGPAPTPSAPLHL